MKKNYIENELEKKIAGFISENLIEGRIKHTYAVRDTALGLGELYGEDEQKIIVASLCHDLFKCFDKETVNKYIEKYGLDKKYINNNNLAHSKLAAYFAEHELNIKDEDILNAISYHTTARANMSRLEKIIYLADAIEPNRRYKDVEKIREMSKIDLDEAVLMTIEGSIEMLKRLGRKIDNDSIDALNFMKNNKTEGTHGK